MSSSSPILDSGDFVQIDPDSAVGSVTSIDMSRSDSPVVDAVSVLPNRAAPALDEDDDVSTYRRPNVH